MNSEVPELLLPGVPGLLERRRHDLGQRRLHIKDLGSTVASALHLNDTRTGVLGPQAYDRYASVVPVGVLSFLCFFFGCCKLRCL